MEKSKMKCPHCLKKTHLTYSCKCGVEFCVKCRLPEIHACSPPKPIVKLEKIVADKMPERV